MKLWCVIRLDNQIVSDKVLEFERTPGDAAGWHRVLQNACHEFDLACPVILQKHVNDFSRFRRAVFRPDDFMEPVHFDKFEVEILRMKKPNLV